ncbi:MAG: hypothetical protein KGO81_14130 [Bacteroidota bacterium]|nr:hypothetical protein [Bacteroidota bacterium]
MKRKIIILLVIFNSCFLNLFAQQSSQKKNGLTLFFEKVYLHLDRDYYTAGDAIWYKAYLVNAQSNYPTYTSNNLYVELISPDTRILDREVVRLNNGVGNGDFTLPDTLSEGNYTIRAYTNWMKNFKDNFVFEKIIKVGKKNPVTIAERTPAIAFQKNNPGHASKTETNYQLSFFPEGGSLIAGIENKVAFKAEDNTGKGIDVEGSITDSKNKIVCSFKSSHMGMGLFSFTPLPDEAYDVHATLKNGKPVLGDIPIAMSKGLQLSVTENTENNIIASVNTNKPTLDELKNSIAFIRARHAGRLVFEDSLHLTAERNNVLIPENILPAGITVITLYDNKMRPNAERLIYIDKKSVKISVKANKPIFTSDDKTYISINAESPDGAPVKANLSMAVVDASIVPVSVSNIKSYLLLQSELKGEIENADTYFDTSNPNRAEQLDMLLLTQGWREYLWLKLAQEGISIRYIPESGITISGKVKKTFGEKALPDMNVTLFAPQAKNTKLFFTKTDTTGHYFIDGVELYGTQRIKLVSKNNKGEKGGFIEMDSLYKNVLPVHIMAGSLIKDTSTVFKNFVTISEERVNEMRKIVESQIKELPGVSVTNNKDKTINLRDQTAMSFGYKDSIFIPNSRDMKDYETLENYLLHKMPGAHADVENTGIYFFANRQQIRPRFIVENREDVFERLDYYTLKLDVISNITIKHLIGTGPAATDIYLIYLTLKPEANQQASPEMLNAEVTGYYEAKQFYIPYVSPYSKVKSYLITISWIPYIEYTGTEKSLYIDNRNIHSKMRVVVEGITDNGTPLFATTSYEVK